MRSDSLRMESQSRYSGFNISDMSTFLLASNPQPCCGRHFNFRCYHFGLTSYTRPSTPIDTVEPTSGPNQYSEWNDTKVNQPSELWKQTGIHPCAHLLLNSWCFFLSTSKTETAWLTKVMRPHRTRLVSPNSRSRMLHTIPATIKQSVYSMTDKQNCLILSHLISSCLNLLISFLLPPCLSTLPSQGSYHSSNTTTNPMAPLIWFVTGCSTGFGCELVHAALSRG